MPSTEAAALNLLIVVAETVAASLHRTHPDRRKIETAIAQLGMAGAAVDQGAQPAVQRMTIGGEPIQAIYRQTDKDGPFYIARSVFGREWRMDNSDSGYWHPELADPPTGPDNLGVKIDMTPTDPLAGLTPQAERWIGDRRQGYCTPQGAAWCYGPRDHQCDHCPERGKT